MKKHTIFILVVTMITGATLSCTSKQQPSVSGNEYLIQGKLENIPDSLLIDLFEAKGEVLHRITTDTLTQGKFTFRDTISAPRTLFLSFSKNRGFPNSSLEVWVAPGKSVQISGQDKLVKTWKIDSDIPDQIEENGYQACVAQEVKELMKYTIIECELKYQIRNEHKENEAFLKKAKTERDSISAIAQKIKEEIGRKTIGYMQTAPVTSLWMNKLLNYTSFLQYGFYETLEGDMKQLYNRMSDQQKQTKAGKLIDSYLNPKPAVGIGDEMADGDLYDLQGNIRHLSEFKGKCILLDFWSSGCGPCMQSIPEMKEVEESYKGKLVIISISEDNEKEWKKTVEEKNMTGNQWNELLDRRSGLATRYQVRGIPYYVFITHDGKIKDMWSGYKKDYLKQKVRENMN